MKKVLVGLLLILSLISFSEIYSIKIDDTPLGTAVLREITDEVYQVVTTIDYGVFYTIESTTTYDGPYFKDYIATFSVDGTTTGRIIGSYDGEVANFTFESQVSSNTISLNKQNLVILDNNFMLSHFLKIIEYPSPIFEIVIPQLLFNPSKTEYAVGEAILNKKGDTFVISFENEKILITVKDNKIYKIEYPDSSITVELVENEDF
ncbi:hypothetical protein [Thermosipho atlanticus]|uniref:Outer membrane lipoprotein-sorting protein n=1 Tax=Thermosipho atlanticus DSM 15807 TaxID=1123380 RepID=A0A1M5RVL0_9BACT|nr:hypothetical protein [Thermosipho atlanticus]SHH30274.1 hypothetical protein SAMN02745199_0646 [Thermosipho atlanticus DSM 15807]